MIHVAAEGEKAMKNFSEKMQLSIQVAALVFVSTCSLLAQSGTGNPVVVNFDSLPTPAGGGCVDATSYLATYSITVTNITPGAFVGACQNAEIAPPSAPNYLNVYGIANLHPVSFTLNFPQTVSSITFTRSEYLPYIAADGTNEGVSGPNWTATALDAQGQQVGNTVSESLFGSFSPVPAATYSLSGKGITALRIDGNNGGFAGFLTAPIDNLTFTPSGLAAPTNLQVTQVLLDSGNQTDLPPFSVPIIM